MPYTPTTWVDGTTPALNAANLNKIEQGIVDAGGSGATTLDDLTDVSTEGTGDGSLLGFATLGPSVWVGLPVTVTESDHYSTFIAANVWDNDPVTNWNTSATTPPWTNADFGTPVSASRIQAITTSVSATWQLLKSTDGFSWTSVLSGIVATTGVGNTYDFALTTSRYWRMTTTGGWVDPCTFRLTAPSTGWIPVPWNSDQNILANQVFS